MADGSVVVLARGTSSRQYLILLQDCERTCPSVVSSEEVSGSVVSFDSDKFFMCFCGPSSFSGNFSLWPCCIEFRKSGLTAMTQVRTLSSQNPLPTVMFTRVVSVTQE
eukprot:591306-Amphidinium_carterae.2